MEHDDTMCVCGGTIVPLGRLGNRWHYRCRYCGLDHSSVYSPEELLDLESFDW